ncbi:RING-H2 finger protein ATL80 [Zea mays]|jgi:hypothetical protein|uniref:RING-type E3 ubiquitin transferase n=2 Tax=Zea mays TaxID=4577 RepID=A0A804R3G0_MAIZE|nr:RING-H2 finger protein ATL80 [Zea mays]|eukprot:XP_020400065.1 RING-H2 finger protein ATL80 [Zea mays]
MYRTSMPSVHRSRMLASDRAAPDNDNIRLCSMLLASVVSLLLLCGALSVVSSTSALAVTMVYVIVGPAAIMLMLVFLGCLVASGTRALAVELEPQPQAPAEAAPARLARRLCACGLSDVADVATMPAFPFQPAQPVAASEGERQPPRRSGVLCAVCLEDVRAGEIVRQLPACRHLFHVECIDVWLRSHRTCPLCRCELPRRKATAQQTVAVTLATPEAAPLPPV